MPTPQLPTHLLLVTVEIDESVEDAFNLWYDREHLPAALACPGVLRGRRYATSKPTTSTDRGTRASTDTRTYLALYELETPQAIDTPEFTAMRGWHQFAPHVRSVTRVLSALSR